ncbi:MAG: tetratricopeptide repeat protein [Sphingobacteriales bacterium]|nr:tetratricopeptide repeat protein [Sphingobacteriales bacterium]
MKKQYLIAAIGFAFVLILFYFGKTTTETKPVQQMKPEASNQFDVQQFILQEKQKLTPELSKSITDIENAYLQTADKSQKLIGLNTAANFWKDTAQNFKLYAFYNSEAAKLDNSEKNLTFAAQQFLTLLRDEHDEAILTWESDEAIRLFQEAIKLNPNNEDLKIGLGSSYVFGKGRNGDPQETMKGIQELLGVVRRDSTNMRAQLVLGIGGYVSGQYDKAISRLTKVIIAQPDNLEAIAFLADTYAAQGNKADAIKWYNVSKRLANNPEYSKEVDNRIKLLETK